MYCYSRLKYKANIYSKQDKAMSASQVAVSAPGIRNVLGLNPTPGDESLMPNNLSWTCIKVLAALKRCGGASWLIITDDDMESEQEPDKARPKVPRISHVMKD